MDCVNLIFLFLPVNLTQLKLESFLRILITCSLTLKLKSRNRNTGNSCKVKYTSIFISVISFLWRISNAEDGYSRPVPKYPQIFCVMSGAKILHLAPSKTIGPMVVHLNFACEGRRNLLLYLCPTVCLYTCDI